MSSPISFTGIPAAECYETHRQCIVTSYKMLNYTGVLSSNPNRNAIEKEYIIDNI